MRNRLPILLFCLCLVACNTTEKQQETGTSTAAKLFTIVQGEDELEILQVGSDKAVVTQNAQANHRPYLHPIVAPNSEAELTEYSPGHHKHQTGLYWGFTRVNGTHTDKATLKKWFYNKDKPADIQAQIGRDFFHHPTDGYWQRVATNILIGEGAEVRWETVYNMLDKAGIPILKESQTWTFTENDGKHFLSLEWQERHLLILQSTNLTTVDCSLECPGRKASKGKPSMRHANEMKKQRGKEPCG